MRYWPIGIVFLALIATGSGVVEAADAYEKRIEAAREQRISRLTSADGWLTLIGLHRLRVGDNSVGRAADNTVRLSAGPDRLGVVTVTPSGEIRFAPSADTRVEIDGRPASGPVRLSLGDQVTSPTTVRTGTVSLFAVDRGGLALRVKDSAASARARFSGVPYFPIDPSWRIEARWVPFETPREISITSVIGHVEPAKIPGKAVFEREGKTYELLAIDEGTGDPAFFVLTDATSGRETYAMRFLYADWPKGRTIFLDFNLAYNPPCAFTPFSTCPLPPPENQLPFAINAGEKKPKSAD